MTILLPTQTLNISERGGMSNAQRITPIENYSVDPRIPFLVKPKGVSRFSLPITEAIGALVERVQQRKLQGIQNEAKNEFTEQANKLLVDYREKKLKGAINGIDDYNNQLDDLKNNTVTSLKIIVTLKKQLTNGLTTKQQVIKQMVTIITLIRYLNKMI